MNSIKTQKFQQIQHLLRCPRCGADMYLEGNSLICSSGHCFDIAAKGYVNLSPGQKALKGYDQRFFENRREIMEQGFYRHVMEGIRDYLSSVPGLRYILDAGCGEGYYAKNIAAYGLSHASGQTVIALDLSKEAVRCASRGGNSVCWLVSDLSHIPLKDSSIDAVLNIFTPANYGEFHRILKEDGRLVKVIPGNAHLRELREAVRGSIRNKEYSNLPVIDHFSRHFAVTQQISLTRTISVEPDQLGALFDMTPLLFHVNKEELEQLRISEITIDALLLEGQRF